MNITDHQIDYVNKVVSVLRSHGIRVKSDLRNEKIGFKIREHTLLRVPFLVVCGDKEMESGEVAVRTRRGADLGAGLNYYRTDYLRSEFYLPFPNDLTFNVYLLLYGVYCRSRFAFFPLSWREEDQVSNAKLAAQTRRMLRMLGQYLFRRRRLFAPCQDARRDYRFTVIAEQHPEGLK